MIRIAAQIMFDTYNALLTIYVNHMKAYSIWLLSTKRFGLKKEMENLERQIFVVNQEELWSEKQQAEQLGSRSVIVYSWCVYAFILCMWWVYEFACSQ